MLFETGSSWSYFKIVITEATGSFCLDWCLRRLLLPVILRIVMTTTLISLSTPSPLKVMP